MGKKLRVQRRGRGGSVFKAKSMGKIAPTSYPPMSFETVIGVVSSLRHETGRGAPLAYIKLNQENGYYVAAPEGVYIDQEISLGSKAAAKVGNVLPLGSIPESTMVCNLELRPGDGGKIAKSSGSFAIVVAHRGEKTTVKLPSKRNVQLSNKCRATIGIVAGGGRTEKPFLKAGERFYLKRAKNQVYPVTKGVKMTAASHPHGGGRHRRPGKSTTVSRHAPPGKKVGLIAARNSGKKKRERGS
ncbi:50S ribosomal protein L2 [Candidatus Bathyarchaeota archaeon]|nr:50S ribosomal protein L2 [Candidatus Bathyarchaeota archaeon]MDP6049163.1 50S ribosomal protein L2 [Candidatus Bathyarchaeota archaeon]MDP7207628.1 50S ribosomal protein L2 [Candidatus Bathyarchaeota archaeon]|tara:strand:+ start:2247 stop:2975 length:729 start_codon:yes stop_codon:yes gene_type:complete